MNKPKSIDPDKLLKEFNKTENQLFIIPTTVKSVPYQLCPMCHGKRYVAISGSMTNEKCDICDGEGIIPQHIIE